MSIDPVFDTAGTFGKTPILFFVDHATNQIPRAFHDLEDLRERLIIGDNKTIGEAIEKYPSIDRQKLRQLVRNAQKERKVNEAQNTSDNKQGRALFRFIREASEQS